jgi:hypothetical protein
MKLIFGLCLVLAIALLLPSSQAYMSISSWIRGVAHVQDVCTMGNNPDCWSTSTQQRIVSANGFTGAMCSFSRDNKTCCVLSFAAPYGSCVTPAQVGSNPQVVCVSAQPEIVTACPRCNLRCLNALACNGQTDGCSYCKQALGAPGSPAVYRCSATAKRGVDNCLNDAGEEVLC